MYHEIADEGPAELRRFRVTPAAFRDQLRHLRRHGYHSITVSDWVLSHSDLVKPSRGGQ